MVAEYCVPKAYFSTQYFITVFQRKYADECLGFFLINYTNDTKIKFKYFNKKMY